MSDVSPNAELLRSLSKLARGLSALFWALPATLIFSVLAARADWLPNWSLLAIVAVQCLLVFGLWQMGAFQPRERAWQAALDRARLLALVDLGLSPFLFWSNRVPAMEFFAIAVLLLALSSLLFLINLNLVLQRLGTMLPDETLRQETRQFTAINRGLLLSLLLVLVGYYVCLHLPQLPTSLQLLAFLLESHANGPIGAWAFVVLLLLPVAMTMALIWKTKEVILESVFSAAHSNSESRP